MIVITTYKHNIISVLVGVKIIENISLPNGNNRVLPRYITLKGKTKYLGMYN